jgi:hypothetical protein
MKVERYYCDFCGTEITNNREHKDYRMSGEILVTKNNSQWSISSYENCHNCFQKVYEYIKNLKREFKIKIEENCNNQ